MRAQSHLLSAMKGSQAPETALRSAAGPAVAPSRLPRPAVEPAEDAADFMWPRKGSLSSSPSGDLPARPANNQRLEPGSHRDCVEAPQ